MPAPRLGSPDSSSGGRQPGMPSPALLPAHGPVWLQKSGHHCHGGMSWGHPSENTEPTRSLRPTGPRPGAPQNSAGWMHTDARRSSVPGATVQGRPRHSLPV